MLRGRSPDEAAHAASVVRLGETRGTSALSATGNAGAGTPDGIDSEAERHMGRGTGTIGVTGVGGVGKVGDK